MNNKKNKLLSLSINKVLLLPFFILLTSFLTSPTVNDSSGLKKIKSAFPSMILDTASIGTMTRIDGFNRFIFQLSGSDKIGLTGGRRVYTLIVFPADSKGNIIGPSIELQKVKGRKQEVLLDLNDEVKLASYHMTKKQYDGLVAQTGKTDLRFDASITGEETAPPSRYFNGYVTYNVYGINASGVKIKSTNAEDDNFLKPSPPAPPDL